jgi:hypothetical protein
VRARLLITNRRGSGDRIGERFGFLGLLPARTTARM